MDKLQPIGVFDSGVGGTSIWKEIHGLMPNESSIYLADSANAPYGLKSKDEIIALSHKNTRLLLEMGCKIVVVACNTATTNAIRELRAAYDIPFIGIEPAIKPAAHQSKTQTIGILATKGTLNSELFNKTAETLHDVRIIEQVGHGLVSLIEEGQLDSIEMKKLLEEYIRPMVEQGIDYLVLGCTHYPYLIPQIRRLLPDHVKIIDSGEAVARQTRNVLENKGLLNDTVQTPSNIFYTNADTQVLQALVGNNFPVSKKDF